MKHHHCCVETALQKGFSPAKVAQGENEYLREMVRISDKKHAVQNEESGNKAGLLKEYENSPADQVCRPRRPETPS